MHKEKSRPFIVFKFIKLIDFFYLYRKKYLTLSTQSFVLTLKLIFMKKSTFLSALILVMTSFFFEQTFAQPINDTCDNATVITSNTTCITIDGTVNGATSTVGLAQGSCDTYSNTYAGEDVWYSFTPQFTSNTIIVRPRGNSSIDAVLVLYTGTCGNLTEVDCNDTSGMGDASISYSNFVVGNTYLIRVYDYGSGVPVNADFTICIQHSASGANVDVEYQNHLTLDGIGGSGTGDGDGVGEPGENISLTIDLINNGTTTAHNVQGTLSCTDSDITITSNTGTWTNIGPGTSESSSDFSLSIASSAIEKNVIMNLTINTDEGSFTDSFLFHIYNNYISVHKTEQLIRDGNGGGTGNSNGHLDPGETISLELKLHNSGNATAHNVSSVLSTSDNDINITNNTVNVGDIADGGNAWAQSYMFDIDANCPIKNIVFTLTVSSNEGSWIDQFVIPINDPATINKNIINKIKIFPNPATQYINITVPNNDVDIQQIEILNMNGQLIIKECNVEQINISTLKNGIYIIKITDFEDRMAYFKFVKQ